MSQGMTVGQLRQALGEHDHDAIVIMSEGCTNGRAIENVESQEEAFGWHVDHEPTPVVLAFLADETTLITNTPLPPETVTVEIPRGAAAQFSEWESVDIAHRALAEACRKALQAGAQ